MQLNRIARLTAAACALAALALAQTPPPPPRSGPADQKTITLVGCLAAGPDANTFSLTIVPIQGKPTGTSGTAGPPATVTYQLSAPASIDLGAHVGHKVEVVGTEVPAKTTVTNGAPEQPLPLTSPEAGAPQPKVAEKPKVEVRGFEVKSLKHLEPTCPK